MKKITILTGGGDAPAMNACMNLTIGKLRGLVSEVLIWVSISGAK